MTAPNLLPQNVDYTTKDFNALRTRIYQLVASVFPDWTDHEVANFGNVLVELFAFVGDVLLFYMDNAARESRITTARLRKSLLGLVKLIGYRPHGAAAATASVTLTLAAPAAGRVTVLAGDRVLTQDVTAPIAYRFLVDVVFLPGETSHDTDVENADPQVSAFASAGTPNQSFTLPATPYVDRSARVSDAGAGSVDDQPDGWSEVDDFLSSTSADRHFVVSADQNDRATLTFGDGVRGRIPTGGGTARYKTGGGTAGRVEANALRRMEKSYADEFGAAVKITVTNPLRSSGGVDRETNAQIAVNAPEALRTQHRCVAREDYEIAAQQVPGVARALALTKNEYAGIGENEMLVFPVPADGSVPTQSLLDLVAAQYAPGGPYPKVNTLQLTVQVPAYLTVNIRTTVYLRAGRSKPAVRAAILAALQSLFAILLPDGSPNPRVNFGYYFQDADGAPAGSFPWSDVFDAVRDVDGVAKVDAGVAGLLLNGQRADLPLSALQFPLLGSVTIVDGANGQPF